jgi:Ribbon-helix-helix protein, copG family
MSVDRPKDLIEGSGQRLEPRRLDQMVSARLDPTLVAALKGLAEKRGVSLSDVLREAALLLLRREEAQNVITFSVNVTNEHTGDVARESFRQDIEGAAEPSGVGTVGDTRVTIVA